MYHSLPYDTRPSPAHINTVKPVSTDNALGLFVGGLFLRLKHTADAFCLLHTLHAFSSRSMHLTSALITGVFVQACVLESGLFLVLDIVRLAQLY